MMFFNIYLAGGPSRDTWVCRVFSQDLAFQLACELALTSSHCGAQVWEGDPVHLGNNVRGISPKLVLTTISWEDSVECNGSWSGIGAYYGVRGSEVSPSDFDPVSHKSGRWDI